jgi:hypothetical protein
VQASMGAANSGLSTHDCCLSTVQDIDHFRWVLTEEAQGYLQNGSPEAQVFNAIPAEGLPMAQLKVQMTHTWWLSEYVESIACKPDLCCCTHRSRSQARSEM